MSKDGGKGSWARGERRSQGRRKNRAGNGRVKSIYWSEYAQPITVLQFHCKDDVSLREDAAHARDKFHWSKVPLGIVKVKATKNGIVKVFFDSNFPISLQNVYRFVWTFDPKPKVAWEAHTYIPKSNV